MAAKIIVFATVLAACNAVPIWYNELPGVVMRIGRSPSISYGFGSGFSSNIGGISHSTGFGTAFQSGDGVAEGYGGGSTDGGSYARGVGIAKAGNSHPVQYHQQPTYQVAPRPSYESAVASAHNLGYGSAVSSAQSGGPARYNSAVSSTHNGYGTALSSANTVYGSAVSSARNSGYGSSVSSAHTTGHNGYGSAVSAAHNFGGHSASTAQVEQQHPGGVLHSGATSINAPGLRAAHSHAVDTGFY